MFDDGSLSFDASAHQYSVRGRVLPSVTQCLKHVRIVDYSHIPQSVLETASKRGTLVHRAIEYDMTGGVDENTIDPRLLPYVCAARKFIADAGLRPERVECRIYDARYGYAGTFDVLGSLANGDRVIVDWKTGALLPGHQVQMSGYAHGTGEPLKYRRILVQLRPDGSYRQVVAARADYQRHFSVFAGAVAATQWWLEHERATLKEGIAA